MPFLDAQWLSSTLANSAPATPTQTHRALILFLIVVTILGVFLVSVVLYITARRLHRRPTRTAPPTSPGDPSPPDPWATAAQRMELNEKEQN